MKINVWVASFNYYMAEEKSLFLTFAGESNFMEINYVNISSTRVYLNGSAKKYMKCNKKKKIDDDEEKEAKDFFWRLFRKFSSLFSVYLRNSQLISFIIWCDDVWGIFRSKWLKNLATLFAERIETFFFLWRILILFAFNFWQIKIF